MRNNLLAVVFLVMWLCFAVGASAEAGLEGFVLSLTLLLPLACGWILIHPFTKQKKYDRLTVRSNSEIQK